VPDDVGNGFIVARVSEDTSLWWFGIYETKERAKEIASEIGGIVLER
jgi:hypothetical protein